MKQMNCVAEPGQSPFFTPYGGEHAGLPRFRFVFQHTKMFSEAHAVAFS